MSKSLIQFDEDGTPEINDFVADELSDKELADSLANLETEIEANRQLLEEDEDDEPSTDELTLLDPDAGPDASRDDAGRQDPPQRTRTADVPESWKIDPATGKPYANGKILGRFSSVDEAYAQIPGMFAEKPASDPKPQPQNTGPGIEEEVREFVESRSNELLRDPSWRPKIDAVARVEALSAYESELTDLGYTLPDPDDPAAVTEFISDLQRNEPGIYRDLKNIERQERAKGAKFVAEHEYVRDNKGSIESSAIEYGYEQFKAAIESAVSDKADADDERQFIRPKYDEAVSRVRAELSKPRPRADIVAQYCDTVAGVPVLNPDKLLRTVMAENAGFLAETVKSHTAFNLRQRIETDSQERIRQTRRHPPSIAGEAGGKTGAARGIIKFADLQRSDIIERLVEANKGDEAAANAIWERSLQYYDEHPEQAVLPQRSVSGRSVY